MCIQLYLDFLCFFFRTFALIKPDGIKCKGKILKMILENGFRIGNLAMVQMTKEQAGELYSAHQGQSYFPLVSTTLLTNVYLIVVLLKLCNK